MLPAASPALQLGRSGSVKTVRAAETAKGNAVSKPYRSLAALGLLLSLLWGNDASSADPVPVVDLQGSWRFLEDYSDEFNGSRLDEQKWNSLPTSWGQWSWDRNNAVVSDGNLRLRMTYEPHDRKGKRIFYKGGIVQTRAKPLLHGYFEARLKGASRSPGVSSAFWARAFERDMATEIDFAELGNGRQMKQLQHWMTHVFRFPGLNIDPATGNQALARPPRLVGGIYEESSFDFTKDFHIYSAEWNEREIVWYVDGHEVHREANKYFVQPLIIVASVGIRPPLETIPTPEGFPTETLFDYIRIWQRSG
jgi:beta-glucanase (GH16 family)